MSSDLQSIIVAIQQNNYLSLAVLIVVVYDYILVLPKEIEYIWNKQWSWVTIMFLLVRYCGLYEVAYNALGSSFIPDPKVCNLITHIEVWVYALFLGAADFVMVLRVWAMYNQSRLILTLLLAMLSIEIVIVMVIAVAYTILENHYFVATQVLGYSFCTAQSLLPAWSSMTNISQITLSAVLCMLAVAQFARQSLQMYRVTKQWKLSRYINLLVEQGILYFLGILLLNINAVLAYVGYNPTTGWQLILLCILEYVPVYTLTPRFIVSIRKMYAHDVQGRRGGGIDSGFGLSTLSLSSHGAAGGPMVFAAGAQSEDVENVEVEDVNGENQVTEVTGDIELVPREIEPAQQV